MPTLPIPPVLSFMDRGTTIGAGLPFVVVVFLKVDPTDTNNYTVELVPTQGGRRAPSGQRSFSPDSYSQQLQYAAFYIASHPNETNGSLIQFNAVLYQNNIEFQTKASPSWKAKTINTIPPDALLTGNNTALFAPFPPTGAFQAENCLTYTVNMSAALAGFKAGEQCSFDVEITPVTSLKILTDLGKTGSGVLTTPTLANVYDKYYTFIVKDPSQKTEFYIASEKGFNVNVDILGSNGANSSGYFIGLDEDNRVYSPANPTGISYQGVYTPPTGTSAISIYVPSNEFQSDPEADIFWLCAGNGTTYSLVPPQAGSGGYSMPANSVPMVIRAGISLFDTTKNLVNTVQGFIFNTLTGELSTTDIASKFGVESSSNNLPPVGVHRNMVAPALYPVPPGFQDLIDLSYVLSNNGITFRLPASVAPSADNVKANIYLNGWDSLGNLKSNQVPNLDVKTDISGAYLFNVSRDVLIGYTMDSVTMHFSTIKAEYYIPSTGDYSAVQTYNIDTVTP
ncbi:hypothetical protein [Brucella anthropi]|uniref:hypothetical protein n=1 Tax=Brucella anthropi TaxID=529 RepID=UPI0039887CFB